MSQRNWKTTQRKTNRNVLQNFASRPISTLSSIKEGSSTTSHSVQSSTSDTSSADNNANVQQQEENHEFASASKPVPAPKNNHDIYQIIEEECHNGENTRPSPKQAFQCNDEGLLADDDIQELIDIDREIENHKLEEEEQEEQEEGRIEGGDDDDEHGYDEDDNNNPVIYAHHDDDSISQITSSIAGYSMYSTNDVLSRQLSGSGSDHNKKVPSINHGGVSHMRPNMFYSNSLGGGSQNSTRQRRNNDENGHREEKSSFMEDEELNKFFGPSDAKRKMDGMYNDLENNIEEKGGDALIDVDIYTNDDNNDNKRYHSESYTYVGNNCNNGGDDLTLRDMYSISSDSRRTFSTEAQNDTSFASIMQKARLKAQSAFIKAKHVINKYVPLEASSNIEQKKNDDIDQYSTSQFSSSQYSTSTSGETDYFEMLMSSSFVSSSSNLSLYRFRNKKENQVNFLWISLLLVLIWLLLYLAKIGNDSAWEQRQMQKLANNIPTTQLRNSGLEPTLNSPLDAPFDSQTGNENIYNVAQVPVSRSDPLPPPPPPHANVAQQFPQQLPQQQLPQQQLPVSPVEVETAVVSSGQVDTSHIGMPLPEYFINFLDVTEKAVPQVPFFWHIPRTAGATINEILATCYHLRLASNAGAQGHEQDTVVQLINVGAGHSYVNVDVSNSQGIQRALSMGLVSSGLSDVIVSPLINEVGPLFDTEHKGRIFTMIRHPVMRAASLFYFLQDVQWKAKATYNEELAKINIHDYFKRKLGESNWQVRFLTNQVTKPYIDENDLKLAKEILRRKVFVGLTSERETSFNRFQKIFGWDLQNQVDVECLNNRLQWDWALRHPHDTVEEETELWDLISAHNKYDVELFEYAKILFKEQGSLL